MRGKGTVPAGSGTAFGITPAYAGKREKPQDSGSRYRGSPPPMRGKAQNGSKRRCVYRITPAYAGKRGQLSDSIAGQWDHPRLCGEKIGLDVNNLNAHGSPPPMRGKAIDEYYGAYPSRITPAYAGKSFSLRRRGCEMWDHPRLCGEKS